jgi:hypothetical protein
VAFATFAVAPGERRVAVLRLSGRAAHRVRKRGRIRLRAGAHFTLAGSKPAAASKSFLLLGSRPRSRRSHSL